MASASIPVDLRNPGQVFACLGLMEAADILLGGARGGFDWENPADVRFVLEAAGEANPVAEVLGFLAEAEVVALSPQGSLNENTKWKIKTIQLPHDSSFPFPDPSSPATLPARLQNTRQQTIVIDYWGDATERDNVKFWAGSQGKPGAAFLLDALDLARSRILEIVANPFAWSAPQSGSLRFDFRRDYVPIGVGFSPNNHKTTMVMRGYPLVEILAAIGMSNARPLRISKLEYRYGAAGMVLPPAFLRATLGCAALPIPLRTFRMRLDWPGQENQARCITDVTEELCHD